MFTKKPEYHCPFGCRHASGDDQGDYDDYGYCRHLIGFTNNGKTYEPLKPQLGIVRDEDNNIVYETYEAEVQVKDVNGVPVVKDGKILIAKETKARPKRVPIGRWRVLGGRFRQAIPPTAVLVNPVRTQHSQTKGIMETTKKWVSDRVYLNGPLQQIDRRETLEHTIERERAQRRKEELEAELEDLRKKAHDDDLIANGFDPNEDAETRLVSSTIPADEE